MFFCKSCVVALFALAASPAAGPPASDDHSLTAAEYVQHGAPALDHVWTEQDYATAAQALGQIPAEQLPRTDSAASGAVMDRLVDFSQFISCSAQAGALQPRLAGCLQDMTAVNRLFGVYLPISQNDPGRAEDLFRLSALIIQVESRLGPLAAQFSATLDTTAPDYSARMAGLAQMQRGEATTLRGVVMMMHSSGVPERARQHLAETLAAEEASLVSFLTAEDRAAFETELRDLADNDANPQVRTILAPYR